MNEYFKSGSIPMKVSVLDVAIVISILSLHNDTVKFPRNMKIFHI